MENNERKGRNWRAKYLQITQWEQWLKEEWRPFITNDWAHLKVKVEIVFWVVLAILGAIIVKWVMG